MSTRDNASVGTIRELAGVMKFYDAVRGFGFVACPTIGDVFVFNTIFTLAGGVPPDGARVVLQAEKLQRGWRALSVVSFTSEALSPLDRNELLKPAAGEWMRAKFKQFDDYKGFGFVTLDDSGKDAFFHREAMIRNKLELNPNLDRRRAIMVRCAKGPKGLYCIHMKWETPDE